MQNKILFISGLICLTGTQAYAINSYDVDAANYSYRFDIYNAGESMQLGDETFSSPFDISAKDLLPLFSSAKSWGKMLQTQQRPQTPLIYSVFSLNDYNASAVSPYVDIAESPYKITLANARINNKTVIGPDEIFQLKTDALINLGLGIDEDNPGWNADDKTEALYSGNLPDLHAVLLHEEMHSLGISSNVAAHREDDGDKTKYFSEDENDSLSVFDKDLRIYTGSLNQPFDINKEIVPLAGMSVGRKESFDVYKYSPYFVGENTLKVLSGQNDYEAARVAIIQNGGLTNYSISYDLIGVYPQVFGMPIHNADGEDIDLSHLELHNSFMSHQSFRNWMMPMEAELAVMQDIGYDIELRKYFGKSYYLNNMQDTYTRGYAEWSGNAYTSNPSQISRAIGIHIYGNNNDIVQASDILSAGAGSVGVRVEGVENTYTLQNGSNISVSGENSLGIAATWGKNHEINVEKDATVSATGENGIAASFNFGANLFGLLNDVRGSYINYSQESDSNKVPDAQTTSALVEAFNVAGVLEGSRAAIYISDNAHVEEINILDGAQIKGDIISDWNSLKSGKNAKVMVKQGDSWYITSPEVEELLYYTDLNVAQDFSGSIQGKISGENGVYNTLRFNNKGNLYVSGNEIAVNSFENDGNINLNAAKISVKTGTVAGEGNLNATNEISFAGNISEVENTVNLAQNAVFSTLNDNVQDIVINRLTTDNAKLYFDLGDKYILQNSSADNTASIAQVKVSAEIAEQLSDGAGIELFDDANKILNLGNSRANIYYGGNKYILSQYGEAKNLLYVDLSAQDATMADALADESTANYIVSEDKQTEDLGTVKGDYFEISGKDIDVNQNRGLVVDGGQNSNGTVLKTGIFGASDANLSVINSGNLEVVAEDDDIKIGKAEEMSLYLENATAAFNAKENEINIAGKIEGNNAETDIVSATGSLINFAQTNNVSIVTDADEVNVSGKSDNTIWQTSAEMLNFTDDNNLSNGNNRLVSNGGKINLANGKANDIVLSKMTLNEHTAIDIDVDLQTQKADSFVFDNTDDLTNNNKTLTIDRVNLLNKDAVLTNNDYFIPFVTKDSHSENILGYASWNGNAQVMTPIYKYALQYSEDENQGGFMLSRGNSKSYGNYNPAITVAPVAAQAGYLSQLNAYDEAFYEVDSKMLPAEKTQGMASGDNYEAKNVWVRPYSSFEKVDLKHGPKTRNNMYGAYFGGSGNVNVISDGWKFQDTIYAGYNTSRQKYDGNSIHQYGVNFGLARALYKDNFFTALTANIGSNQAKAETMYGKEDFYMLLAGVASKSGYNWKPQDSRLVVQPNYQMSYTFVKTFRYKNAAGVRIKPSPLHAVNIAPGMKVMYEFDNGWKPYAEAKMVWSLFDKTDFKAQNADLPEMSVKPYVEYGVGLQKSWQENLAVYGQTMFRSGGRSGVDISAGVQWNF